MSQKGYRWQIVGISTRRGHPEIISVHSRPANNFRQMKLVSIGFDIIQLVSL